MAKHKNQNSGTLILFFSFWLFALSFAFTCLAQDKIIAIVNKEVVTQKDLDDFSNFMKMQLSRQYQGRELEKRLEEGKRDMLEKMIEDRLILQEAKKSDIRVEENRVKAKIDEIRRRYNSDVEFQNDLAHQGLVLADLENKIREQMLMYYIVEYKVREKVVIRPEEVTSFYGRNTKEFISGDRREFTVIALENEDQAKAFSYGLKTGAKLEELASRYPVTVNQMSAVKPEELRKEISQAVFNLGVKEVSNPVNIDELYYIFRLEEIAPSRQLTLLEVQDKIQIFLYEQKMQQELSKWLDELKKNSYIKIVQD